MPNRTRNASISPIVRLASRVKDADRVPSVPAVRLARNVHRAPNVRRVRNVRLARKTPRPTVPRQPRVTQPLEPAMRRQRNAAASAAVAAAAPAPPANRNAGVSPAFHYASDVGTTSVAVVAGAAIVRGPRFSRRCRAEHSAKPSQRMQ
jgi:hypothetical protein